MFTFASPVFKLSGALFAVLVLLSPRVDAVCLPCQENFARFGSRSVYVPHITSPTSSSVWTVGSTATVTWNTNDMPKEVTNPDGKVVLGYRKKGDSSEHLDLEHPLAKDFSIHTGHVSFTVPNIPERDYFVVLFGDSGNLSPTFHIKSDK